MTDAGVIFSDLEADTIPRLQAWLDARAEAATLGVEVSNATETEAFPAVTVVLGPGLGMVDTIDDTTLRLNVYHEDEAKASRLALLVRAFFDSIAANGKPITRARVTAGPVAVPNKLRVHQWYMVVNVTRRGTPLT